MKNYLKKLKPSRIFRGIALVCCVTLLSAHVVMAAPSLEEAALSPEAARNYIKSTPEVVLIDVRSPKEYNNGHLENAKNIPVDSLKDAASMIPADKAVVLYCRSGKRARHAFDILREVRPDIEHLSYVAGFIVPGVK